MTEKDASVYWRGKLVGKIRNLDIDNFDVFGIWIPSSDAVTEEFRNEIEETGEAVIRIGLTEPKWLGTIEVAPDDEIEIKIRPNLESIWEKQSLQ